MLGELVPLGGGDTIPLLKKNLLVGRRESCDIVLRFANVSAHHCQLVVRGGYWFVKDLKSRNGVKVNSNRVSTEKRLDPGDVLAVARHKYEIHYSPIDLGAMGPPPTDSMEDVMATSLLERSGLVSKLRGIRDDEKRRRYNPEDDSAGQINTHDRLKKKGQ